MAQRAEKAGGHLNRETLELGERTRSSQAGHAPASVRGAERRRAAGVYLTPGDFFQPLFLFFFRLGVEGLGSQDTDLFLRGAGEREKHGRGEISADPGENPK